MSAAERRTSKWDGIAAQVIEDYRAGLPWALISARRGIPKGAIAALLARHGVRRERQDRQNPPADAIVRLYVEDMLSQQRIGALLGISANAVREVLDRRGVEVRPSGPYAGAEASEVGECGR